MSLVEIFGYIGSALVIISFLMTSVVKLRLVNMAGGIISSVYALIIGSYPLAIMNIVLVFINLHFLWKMHTQTRQFELVEVRPDDAFLAHLLETWGDDIRACFPGIDIEAGEPDVGYVMMFEGTPVAVTMGRHEGDNLALVLDYSTPAYRDFSIGKFLFAKLKEMGLRSVTYVGPTEHHTEYLTAMGFEGHNGKWGKIL